MTTRPSCPKWPGQGWEEAIYDGLSECRLAQPWPLVL